MSYGPTCINLKKNCRNTNQIIRELEDITGIDSIESRDINGPKVIHFDKTTDIQEYLTNFLEENPEFSTQDIVILGPQPFAESSVFSSRNGQVHIYELDAFAHQNSRRGIGYATISDYKGLESTIVILVDIDTAPDTNYLYVGITRARVLLLIQK